MFLGDFGEFYQIPDYFTCRRWGSNCHGGPAGAQAHTPLGGAQRSRLWSMETRALYKRLAAEAGGAVEVRQLPGATAASILMAEQPMLLLPPLLLMRPL